MVIGRVFSTSVRKGTNSNTQFGLFLPHLVTSYARVASSNSLVIQCVLGIVLNIEDLAVKHNREVPCSCEPTF